MGILRAAPLHSGWLSISFKWLLKITVPALPQRGDSGIIGTGPGPGDLADQAVPVDTEKP